MASDAYDEPERDRWGPWLQPQFDTPLQQYEAAKHGMWRLLAVEVLFFGGLFVAYGVSRALYPAAFEAGSAQLDDVLGTIGTSLLLIGSFTAIWAVRAAQLGERQLTTMRLGITIVCGLGFLALKLFEYEAAIASGLLPGNQFDPVFANVVPWIADQGAVTVFPAKTHVFFGLYFVFTGLHGVTVAAGIGALVWILIRNRRGHFEKAYWTPVELAALNWHLVGLLWIFIFPLLYLI